MTCKYDFVEDDDGTLKITCTDEAGAVINLTGATVTLNIQYDSGVVASKTMTITDEPNGLAEYKFLDGELIPPLMEYEAKILDSAGDEIRSNCTGELKIRSKIA